MRSEILYFSFVPCVLNRAWAFYKVGDCGNIQTDKSLQINTSIFTGRCTMREDFRIEKPCDYMIIKTPSYLGATLPDMAKPYMGSIA